MDLVQEASLCPVCLKPLTPRHKQGYHTKCMWVSPYQKGYNKVVRCHLCREKFRLDWWQHPKMAWCKKCRETTMYRAFSSTIGEMGSVASMRRGKHD